MKNTVADLIEYLKTLPPETTIQVAVGGYSNFQSFTEFVDLDINDNTYYYDKLKRLDIGTT